MGSKPLDSRHNLRDDITADIPLRFQGNHSRVFYRTVGAK